MLVIIRFLGKCISKAHCCDLPGSGQPLCKKHTQRFHFFSRLMKFLFQLTWEQLSHQACLFAGSVSFQSRSQSLGYRDVVYMLPMESNTSKLLHSTYSSRSERSLCVKSDTQLLHNLLIVGGPGLPAGGRASPFKSVGPSFVTVDVIP